MEDTTHEPFHLYRCCANWSAPFRQPCGYVLLASFIKAIRAEPLFVFSAIGIAIFVLNGWLNPASTNQTDVIVIEQERIDLWRDQFRRSNGRAPSEDEQSASIQQWVDEEVLYRQALLLGLHQNDSIVRRQLIRKMEFVIEGAAAAPPASDPVLQEFMGQYPGTYDTAAKTSLQHVYFGRGQYSNAVISAQLQELQINPDQSLADVGDGFALGKVIHNADETLLRKHFGEAFVQQLSAAPTDEWTGPITSGLGTHLVRVTQLTPPHTPVLNDVRKKVAVDYRLHQNALTRRQTLDELRKAYDVKVGNELDLSKSLANSER